MDVVLVVDDNSHVRKIAGWCLEEHGLTPLFAGNGREALEVMRQQRPDAVLTDLHMPEMDGLKLVKQIRKEFPRIPVVLMTDPGSEKTAAAALRAGAASYVPKADLKTDLCEAMKVVVAALDAKRSREHFRETLQKTESRFVIGYDSRERDALVSHLQNNLSQLKYCDETGLFQVSTAMTEALDNAIDHGNLELDSILREGDGEEYSRLREERLKKSPYRDRRVYVIERLSPSEVTYVVLDEGPGFDPSGLPDPKEAENLLKASGRGIMLIQTFMDEVSFNEAGNQITMTKRRVVKS